MNIFKLPDLGEGLPNAIIREWHVKVGDPVKIDQPIVSMETAKALVEVPSPLNGTVEKLFGKVDDTIETGQPLIGFEGNSQEEVTQNTGTVVGALEQSDAILEEAAIGITTQVSNRPTIRTTPAVRALAKRLNIKLSTITPEQERITAEEVYQAAKAKTTKTKQTTPAGMEKLSLVRQAMHLNMSQSHREVVPVTLSDEVDISAWKGKDNITIRLVRALQTACDAEPMLNATFHAQHIAFHFNKTINLGLAIDTAHGLYTPVLKDIAAKTDDQLREEINQFKQQALDKTIPQEDSRGATIILSNFGTIAGRYGTPIILPPMTAIVGIGRLYEAITIVKGAPATRPMLPLSITADHRIITGGEVARFLRAMMDTLTT